MDCAEYRKLYPDYSKLPLPREVWDTPLYEAYTDHFHDCGACGDWTMARIVEKRGARVEDFPCVHIAYRVTEKFESTRADPSDDPDVVIWRWDDPEQYGIPVRDGGASMIAISHCPWCGTELPVDDD